MTRLPIGTIDAMEADARGSVLVVDDEPTIAEVVARYLERAGYRTEHDQIGPVARGLRQRLGAIVGDLGQIGRASCRERV